MRTCIATRHSIGVAASLLSLIAAYAASAQTPAPPSNPLVELMPELRAMPAPDWVCEGLRATYYGAAASLPADRFYVYRNERGNLIKAEEAGPAGAGLFQYTVIAKSDREVVGSLMNYVINPENDDKLPTPAGAVADVAGAGLFWVSPAALATAERFQSNNLLVMKTPYELEGQSYDAIRFHYQTDTAVTSSVHDLKTGLLLFFRSAVLSTDGRHTELTTMHFLSQRKLNIPWAGNSVPDWVPATPRLQYAGGITVMIPGCPTAPMPVTMAVERTGGGATWAKYAVTTCLQGMFNSAFECSAGARQLYGGLWMSPDALAGLHEGQVLDEDPLTEVRATVSGITPGPDGDAVLITEAGRGFQRTMGYSKATGKLMLLDDSTKVGLSVMRTQVQLAATAGPWCPRP